VLERERVGGREGESERDGNLRDKSALKLSVCFSTSSKKKRKRGKKIVRIFFSFSFSPKKETNKF
jgi:hypothetical protein